MVSILLADDESIERKYLQNLFSRHKEYQVVGEAQNGAEIVDLARRKKPDIILMDINMPMMNGLESARKIKQQFPDTIIILNTAYADFEFAKKALDYRLDAYLLKPSSEKQIIDTIEKCIAQCMNRGSFQFYHLEGLVNKDTQSEVNAIQILISYIDENYYQDVTLETLADLVHFSPSYVSKIFHRETGQTVKSYINKMKIKNAKYLLANTRRPIQEVAKNSGFINVSHFNRIFKQYTDLTPQQYRLFTIGEHNRSD